MAVPSDGFKKPLTYVRGFDKRLPPVVKITPPRAGVPQGKQSPVTTGGWFMAQGDRFPVGRVTPGTGPGAKKLMLRRVRRSYMLMST